MAEELAGELAEHLGMASERARLGYNSLQHEREGRGLPRHVTGKNSGDDQRTRPAFLVVSTTSTF